VTPFYQDESCVIYHGDCREVLPFLPKTDLLLTDPPYGIGFAAQPTKWQRRAGKQAETWDDETVPDWLIVQAISKVRHAIVWGGNYYPLPVARCWLSWFKPDAPPSMGNVEYAWTNLDQNSRQISVSIGATNGERVGHPNQKPESVMRWALLQVPDGCAVLDPFMGSGTTLVAAKRLGRKAIGIERELKYCEMAVERLAQGALGLEMEPVA
jgi:site-specific DNA-methyltransferase (adenine-specific)